MKIVLIIVAACVQIIQIIKNKEKGLFNKKWVNKFFIFIQIVTVIGLLWVGILEIGNLREQNKINALIGKFGTQKDCSIKNPILILGNSGFSDNRGGAFSFEDPIQPIKIWCEKKQINIQANVRDSKGDVFASLYEREWEIMDDSNIDYNNDDSAFEIISGGRVIFQLQLKKDTVLYNGLLCSESGHCWFVNKNGMYTAPNLKGPQRFNIPPDFIVNPIFKYPRSRYVNERIVY